MKGSFKFIAAVSAITLLGACSPSVFHLPVEMRLPSDSGYDFTGKSISVVYVDKGLVSDSTFTKNIADGFALKLEEDFFDGETAVNFYTIPYSEDANYSSKDTLVNLVMDTGDDVVVLLDSPKYGHIIKGQDTGDWNVPFQVSFHIYDSMGKIDTVKTYVGKSDFNGGSGEDPLSVWNFAKTPAINAGYLAAYKFSPNWQKENHYLYAYEGDLKWLSALDKASESKWEEARSEWMALANCNGVTSRSAAAYNVAVACYFLQQYDLALEWLDQSDSDRKLTYSAVLRRYCINKKALQKK